MKINARLLAQFIGKINPAPGEVPLAAVAALEPSNDQQQQLGTTIAVDLGAVEHQPGITNLLLSYLLNG